jgi:hypothetical protein
MELVPQNPAFYFTQSRESERKLEKLDEFSAPLLSPKKPSPNFRTDVYIYRRFLSSNSSLLSRY